MIFALQQLDRDQQGVRIEFQQNHDRMAHHIGFVSGDQTKTVLVSVESNDGLWPTSPPLQQLSPETHQQQKVILGVGMSGRNHWSVAVQTSQIDGASVAIEAACRVSTATDRLGSQYQVAPGWSILSQSTARFLLVESSTPQLGVKPVRLRLVADSGMIEHTSHAAGIDGVVFKPPPIDSLKNSTTTISWSYRISLVDSTTIPKSSNDASDRLLSSN